VNLEGKEKGLRQKKSVYFTSRAMLITCVSNCYLSPTLSVVLLITTKLSTISSLLISIDWCSRIVCIFSEQKIFVSKRELHNYSWQSNISIAEIEKNVMGRNVFYCMQSEIKI
jgi:hypothetical protein